jgi:hypothetical protein
MMLRVSNRTDFGMQVLSALTFLGHVPSCVESIPFADITVGPNYCLFHFAHICHFLCLIYVFINFPHRRLNIVA